MASNVVTLIGPIWADLWCRYGANQLRKGTEPMQIQTPPPAIRDIVRAIESRRNVSLAK